MMTSYNQSEDIDPFWRFTLADTKTNTNKAKIKHFPEKKHNPKH